MSARHAAPGVLARLFGAGLLVCWIAATSPADAKEPTAAELAQARELFSKAERDERAKDWKSALEKLQAAGAIKMTAGIRFHVALCQENLGQLVDALASYEAAATQAREDNARDVLEAIQEPLSDLRGRVPSLTLSLANARPEEVDITLDDRALGAAELGGAIRLGPGTHHLVARRRTDGKTFTKDVVLHERDSVAMDLRLAPVGAPAAGEPAAGAPAVIAAPPQEKRNPSRTGAILATGGAALLIGGGVLSLVAAKSALHDDLDPCSPHCTDDEKRFTTRAWQTAALGAFVSSAALGVVAIVLWTRPGSDSKVALSPGPRGAVLSGRF
jgi:hypothetical protein